MLFGYGEAFAVASRRPDDVDEDVDDAGELSVSRSRGPRHPRPRDVVAVVVDDDDDDDDDDDGDDDDGNGHATGRASFPSFSYSE